jgi:excisionase family DNA binding protein
LRLWVASDILATKRKTIDKDDPIMVNEDVLDQVMDSHEAELAKVAQRCIMAALDHSRAPKIQLIEEGEGVRSAPVLELPPRALRVIADLLGFMGQQQPIMLMPQKHELTTQEAAAFLNVSRPFIIKQIETGALACRKIGRHRRIEFHELMGYKQKQKQNSEAAMQKLVSLSQELELY